MLYGGPDYGETRNILGFELTPETEGQGPTTECLSCLYRVNFDEHQSETETWFVCPLCHVKTDQAELDKFYAEMEAGEDFDQRPSPDWDEDFGFPKETK